MHTDENVARIFLWRCSSQCSCQLIKWQTTLYRKEVQTHLRLRMVVHKLHELHLLQICSNLLWSSFITKLKVTLPAWWVFLVVFCSWKFLTCKPKYNLALKPWDYRSELNFLSQYINLRTEFRVIISFCWCLCYF